MTQCDLFPHNRILSSLGQFRFVPSVHDWCDCTKYFPRVSLRRQQYDNKICRPKIYEIRVFGYILFTCCEQTQIHIQLFINKCRNIPIDKLEIVRCRQEISDFTDKTSIRNVHATLFVIKLGFTNVRGQQIDSRPGQKLHPTCSHHRASLLLCVSNLKLQRAARWTPYFHCNEVCFTAYFLVCFDLRGPCPFDKRRPHRKLHCGRIFR